MTALDIINIVLRLQMAGKESESELVFDSGVEGQEPFTITGIRLDEDGDICLESDIRAESALTPSEIAIQMRNYEPDKLVYFVVLDASGESFLYNVKDGGTKDRYNPQMRVIPVSAFLECLQSFKPDSILHFESGTINFTINSIYQDDQGCVCLESTEIMELDDYPVSLLVDELSSCDRDSGVYFYDDDSKEYYGIFTDECREDERGDIWMKIR